MTSLQTADQVGATPAWLRGLVDDAAIFPPGNAPLDRAVAEHAQHRAASYAGLVGGFVVSDVRLPELIEFLEGREVHGPLRVNVVVTGGAGSVEPAVRWATRSPHLQLGAVEAALRDLDDLAGAARRMVAATDALEPELAGVDVYVELPWDGAGREAALEELAARELHVKLRTGGLEAAMFPTAQELAATVDRVLDQELPFKCTAGLHNAVRHTDPETGFEHHGFLNVLLATRATLDGDDPVAVLEQRDGPALVARARELGDAALTRTRGWFTGFGSCAVAEAAQDLRDLGLLTEPTTPTDGDR